MPTRVATFFRSHTNSFEVTAESKKTPKATKRSSSRPKIEDRTPSASSSLHSEDNSVKMPSKRLSLGLSSPKASLTKIPQHHNASLEMIIESPPLVFYGAASSSSGALLSGQLILHINEDFVSFENFNMRLAIEVTRKKPFHAHCEECMHQNTELQNWKFMEGPATLRRGEHTFPFSFLLPGHLPASMKGNLSIIDYALRATVTPKNGESIKLMKSLDIKRAICPADTPRKSIRIFPPTNLTANCELPSVIHPIGQTMVSLRIDGSVKRNPDTKSQTQWKLKRLNWRLDETQKTISPACPKHALKAGSDEAKKGIAHQDVRTIGTDEMKSGWKADYSTPDGSIELEFPMTIRGDSKPICDLKSEDGTEVSHVLVVEMIVAEEFCPTNRPNQITPTGAARVLRMHFNTTLTQRAGMGISWDEEQPPLYENVPASPPGYGGFVEDYMGSPIPDIPDYEDLEPLDSMAGPSIVGATANLHI
ncbi:hypothetical protein VTL71DRAFT_506 [Oculimacula yallundae]|uniref:LDB19 N-terminal domain-containing protein n=1 Tax=Oculimacula yallundae TaxID=86028 RepID=A0ABR4D1R8_9HELO